jgi:hypothetical protein
MISIQDLFGRAQLAEAAYARFDVFANPKDALLEIEISDTQATTFVNNQLKGPGSN